MFCSVFPSRVNGVKDYKCLTPYQFDAELSRCLQCQKKPCQLGCPCNCNPKEFIRAARGGRNSDINLAALIMYSKTPSSSTCGTLCPTDFCMWRCCRSKLDSIPVNITAVQSEIARRAHIDNNGEFLKLIPVAKPTGKTVAVIGAGPSGLACAACLGARGHKVVIYEKNSIPGGDINYIPQFRRPLFKDKTLTTVDLDAKFTASCGDITFKYNTEFPMPSESGQFSDEAQNLIKQYDAICWCVGQQIDTTLAIPGSEKATKGREFLKIDPKELKGKNVAIIGCGAVAIDCAILASRNAAKLTRIIYRRTLKEAPLSPDEQGLISSFGISVIPTTIVTSLETNSQNNSITMNTVQVSLPDLKPIEGTEQKWVNIDYVITAIGEKGELPSIYINKSKEDGKLDPNFSFIGGTALNLPRSMLAVEAAASGKNAAMQIDAYLNNKPIPEIPNPKKSEYPVFEINLLPSSLETTVSFDGVNKIQIPNPFVAAVSPFTDNYYAVQKLLEDGWAGVVIKVSSSPRHVRNYPRNPNENFADHVTDRLYKPGYYFVGELNVDQVKEIVLKLRKDYPNRLFIASIDSDSPTFEKDIQALDDCEINAIQISSNGKEIQVKSKHPILFNISISQSESNQSHFVTVDLTRHYPSNKAVVIDENMQSMRRLVPVRGDKLQGGFAVCGGIKNDSDALFYLSQGAQFVEVDPSSLENDGLAIELTNAMMSHFIHSQKFNSLQEFINKKASIKDLDIEDIQTLDSLKTENDERLICKLTNPYVCIGCGRCVVCPNTAIDLEPAKWKYVIDPERCVGCGLCVSRCPTGAISLVKRGENDDSH